MRIRRGFDLNRRSNKIKRMPTHGKVEFEKLKTTDDFWASNKSTYWNRLSLNRPV